MTLVTALVTALLAVVPVPRPALDLTTSGLAWWTEPGSGRVVVSADDTVSPPTLRRLAAAGAIVEREPGVRRPTVAGGDQVNPTGSAARCTVGFNARGTTAGAYTYNFFVAAHCVGPIGSTVSAGTTLLGVVTVRDSTRDIAVVRYTNPAVSHPSAVTVGPGTLRSITAFGMPTVGTPVQRVGLATGLRSGTITAVNATVNFPGGTLTGLARTTACAEPGDSGGPFFTGPTGLGVTAGASGNCTSGGVSYFTPIRAIAVAYNLTPY